MSEDSTREPQPEPASSLEPPRRWPPTAVGTGQLPRPPRRPHGWHFAVRVVTPVQLPFRIAAGVLAPACLAVAALDGMEAIGAWPPPWQLAVMCPAAFASGALFAFVAWTGRAPAVLS